MTKLMMLLVAIVTVDAALAGRALEWVGKEAGNWSTAANWTDTVGKTNAVPQNGDSLTLKNANGSNNDLTALELDMLTLTGNWMKLTGNPMVFREGSNGVVCSNQTDFTMPLCLEGTNAVFNSPVSGSPFKLNQGISSYNDQPCGFVKTGVGPFSFSPKSGSSFNNFRYVRIAGGTLFICVNGSGNADLLPAGMEYTFTASGTTFSLGKDYNLEDGVFYETGSAVGGSHAFTTQNENGTVRNCTLTMSGTPKTDPLQLTVTFDGSFSFCWNPSAADKTFVLSGSTSTTTGKVTVANGTFRLTNGATFTRLTELALTGGANSRFAVDTNPGTPFSCQLLNLSTGAERLVLSEGVFLTFGAISVGGQCLEPGYYTGAGGPLGEEVTWIEGTGVIMIPGADVDPVTYVWTGNGEDTRVSNPENWGEKGTTQLPPLNSRTMAVRVAKGGTITLDSSVMFYGVTVSVDADVTFAGDHTLALGPGGFTSADGTGRTYTLGAVHLSNPQTWTTRTGDTLNLNGVISGSGSNALTLNTAGTVNFNATNRFSSPLVINRGTLHIHADNALGDDNVVSVDGAHAALTFHGGTWTSRINYTNTCTSLTFAANTTNVFKNAVQNLHGVTWGWTVEEEGVVRFQGGNNRGYTGRTDICGPGETHFDYPTYGGGGMGGSKAKIYFNAEGCEVGTLGLQAIDGPVEVHTTVPGAFSSAKPQRLRLNDSEQTILDLHGGDQWLEEFQARSADGLVKSEKGALLHLATDNYVASSSTNLATFVGGAGVSFDGTTFLRLMTPSASTGTVQVTRGRLEIATTWSNATAAVVNGGVLDVENRDAFGRHTSVIVSSGAEVRLNYRDVMHVGALYIDGEMQPVGLYGAGGRGRNPSGVFTGPGLLRVGMSRPVLIYR